MLRRRSITTCPGKRALDAAMPPRKRKRSIETRDDDDCLRRMDLESAALMRRVPRIELGRFVIDTWYPSPYPASAYPDGTLYLCERCLGYTSSKRFLQHHKRTECALRKPPGPRVYYEKVDRLALYDVDGKLETTYAQNLCLLAKLFMDQKTLYYDVTRFRFYVLCRVDDDGSHIVGYFSKEKMSPEGYNLSCIVVLPPYQRHGYGSLLISISYAISAHDGQLGTPERPLSALGQAAYVEYWKHCVLRELAATSGVVSIAYLTDRTSILPQDIAVALLACGLLKTASPEIPATQTIRASKARVRAALESVRPLRLCQPRAFAWRALRPSTTP
ncbi:hypothetical protein SDRG_01181 [Saprolegnia diclina VS20]|uniref:Histone acetyltransferase n=1 Tax=Saprolegnia diclina (strain VS20) TaxID=1156394 RepID=T0R4C5_SAPDV|nr:hypothetical protein SDRG_01181 [Saprolegnia diclina VS20]EQC41205.1 hypothetical protein SDRG_01181 [Saprolegnia diclina VS20]|eukprot:XP_008604919.1 hypothetical protein SDRG_01181 [Saprolegnia diclina VS20]